MLRTLVITGARGYIGSALAKRLAGEGYALRLVSRSSAAPPIEAPQDASIEYCEADLRDPRAWSRLLKGATGVVHLSSRTDLRAAEADPADDEDINIQPVRALVQAARAADAPPTVVFASAVTIAGVAPQNPVDETTPDLPCSVYDRHKLECETIVTDATRGGVLRACSLRLANVYGYGEGTSSINSNRGVLNAMMRRAIGGEPLTLFGDGSYVRDFIHLDDVIEAFRLAAFKADACNGRCYVIATGRGHTLAEAYEFIAEAALERLGRRIEIRYVPEPQDLQPIEKRNFVGNSRLFQERAGWRPRFDLKAGIRDYFYRAIARPIMVFGQ
jgi:nucleoside-diphosphate-sugar epimerase